MEQATHWFADKLIDYNQSQDTGMMIIKIPSWEYFELKAQAKEMEKQQIIESYKDSTCQFSVDSRIDYPKSAEQYYKETYGK